jgi:multiple RNA-binding domain-containing protein 1
MPKKFDGTHRGFAFVEFVSKGEAAKAMASLHATHLYGRHLVLQYAEEERSVDAMREKLRSQMDAASAAQEEAAAQGGGARRGKKRKGGDGEDGVDEPIDRLRL